MLKRTLYLSSKHESPDALFDRGTEGICRALGAWAKVDLNPAAMEPRECEWDGYRSRAEITFWQSPLNPLQRLWELILSIISVDGRRLERRLQVGQEGDAPLILREEWILTPVQSRVRATNVAYAFVWLTSNDSCLNSDNRTADAPLNLQATNVQCIIEFLHSPVRQLPILVLAHPVSLTKGNEELADSLLRGLCHLVSLNTEAAMHRWRSQMPAHDTFGGALRLYYPNFDAGDNPWDHPFWRGDVVRAEPTDVLNEIFERAAAWSLRVHGVNPLSALHHARVESERAELHNRARDALAKSRATKAEKEEFEALWETFAHENDDLIAENKRLREQVRDLGDDVRDLRYHLDRKLDPREDDAPDASADEAVPALRVTDEVYEKLSDMDKGERELWNERIFRRLLSQQMREAHTESFQNPQGGTLWIYPRGRQADGRRVIYRNEDNLILVYKIFTSDEHDSDYQNIYRDGIPITSADDCFEWAL